MARRCNEVLTTRDAGALGGRPKRPRLHEQAPDTVRECARLLAVSSVLAAERLIQLIKSPDDQVALAASTYLLSQAIGKPVAEEHRYEERTQLTAIELRVIGTATSLPLGSSTATTVIGTVPAVAVGAASAGLPALGVALPVLPVPMGGTSADG